MFRSIRILFLFALLTFACWYSYQWYKFEKYSHIEVGEFHHGMAVAKKEGKYGYIDPKYKTLIEYQFDFAEPFNNNRAVVGISFGSYYKYRLIDEKGQFVSDFYDELKDIGMDRYKAFKNTNNKKKDDPNYYQWHMIDNNGRIISKKTYTHMDDFYDGLARICIKDRCGFITQEGTERILLGNASDADKIIKSYDYRNGKLDTRTGGSQSFHDGLAINEKDGLIGFMNNKAQLIIPHQFYEANNFSDGVAVVRNDVGYGVINTKGDFIIKPNEKYRRITSSYKGYLTIESQDAYLLANNKGNIIVAENAKYSLITNINDEGLFMVKKDGLYGFIDTQGKLVLPLIYSDVWGGFENGLVDVTKKDEPNKIYRIDKHQKVHGESTLTTY
ncbi:WG repeat-containing protein [Moraxella oblonga]|uniref:WG repeat-containing protein n=1 Tax=Moraxella oblonga TaxID=200413 RepID=UPI000830C421|nr:WG repeat-containing protein [Moraxella oblonga]